MELAGSTAVHRLISRVRDNVKAHVGMSNEAVEELCRQVCSHKFQGLFSADRIPSDRLKQLEEFVIVVNTATSDEPLGHFVTLSRAYGSSYVEYMDSFAKPCTQPDVRAFVRSLGLREGEVRSTVKRRVQAASSVYCGLYATLFAAYKDREPGFELLFSPTDLTGNDERCVRYLRRIIYMGV